MPLYNTWYFWARVQRFDDSAILAPPSARYCTNETFDSMRTDRRSRYGSVHDAIARKMSHKCDSFFLAGARGIEPRS